MNNNYCGANCDACPFRGECAGCLATCGAPFGGRCVAAAYINAGGPEAYGAFKAQLTAEINALLAAEGLPQIDGLFELRGAFVNLPYQLPSGETVRFLDDRNIYLGAQIEFADRGVCYGVAADTGFILICSYSVDGSEPELVLYRKR